MNEYINIISDELYKYIYVPLMYNEIKLFQVKENQNLLLFFALQLQQKHRVYLFHLDLSGGRIRR